MLTNLLSLIKIAYEPNIVYIFDLLVLLQYFVTFCNNHQML